MKKWRKIKSKVVYASPRFKILEDDVFLPDGSRGKYYYRASRPGVAVIPFDGRKICLVNQYRYPISKRTWELPIGRAEDNNFLAQAKKELKEETGLTAKVWKYLGSFHPVPGSGTSLGKVFFAQGLTSGEPSREPGESDMFQNFFTMKEIDKMVAAGKIMDGWTLSALYLFKLKMRL